MNIDSRRTFLRTPALLLVATLGLPAAQGQSAVPVAKNRLVMQVSDNDPARWNMVLNNAKNAQDDVGASNIEIEIVAYGPGINMLKKDSVVGERVSEAIKGGVRIVGCENTMKGFKLSKSEMLPVIGYVPAGITELMKKQQDGWAYVRP